MATCQNPCCSSLPLPLSSQPSPYAHFLHQPQNRNSATFRDRSTSFLLKAFIGALEREMGACDEQISYVETILFTLQAQRDKIADTIREHRRIFGAVHDIPTEILLKIFGYYLDDCNGCDLEMHRGRSGPWILADVCQRWKEVAEATPSLWTNITLPDSFFWSPDKLSLVKRAARCSASNLLTLSIDLTERFYSASPFPLLSKKSALWRALHVKTTSRGLEQMGAPSRFDELRELWLSFTGKPGRVADIDSALELFNHASTPKLYLLRIDSETIEAEDGREESRSGDLESFGLYFVHVQSSEFPFASLTHLVIQTSFGHSGGLLTLLGLCTNIEELNLTQPTEQVDQDQSTTRITLSCLTTLIIDGMEWVLSRIKCPRIHNMTLSDIGARYILRFLRRNPGIALDSATFNAVDTHPDFRHEWREILRLLPTVRSLTFEFLLGTSAPVDARDCGHVPFHIFRTLGGSTDACLLLTEFHVVFVVRGNDLERAPFNLDGQALDIVFQSREATLSNVSVCCKGWAEDSWEQESMVSELREDAAHSSIYKALACLRGRAQVVFKSTVYAGLRRLVLEDDYFEIPTEHEPCSEEERSEEESSEEESSED